MESVPVGEFREVVGANDEGDVGAGVFVVEFGNGVESITGAGAEGLSWVDDALGMLAEGFTKHGEAVVRLGAGRVTVFVRISVSWDDADLAEWESLDECVEHGRVSVVDGIERSTEDDDGVQ